MQKNIKILKLLLEKQLITNEQFENLINKNYFEIKTYLLDNKIVDEEKLGEIEANIYNLPYISLIGKKIEPAILKIIPIKIAQNYKAVCFAKENNLINVALARGDDYKTFEAIDFLAKEKNYQVNYYFTSKTGFDSIIKQYHSLKGEVKQALKTVNIKKQKEEKIKKSLSEEIQEITKKAPVSKIVSVIIRYAVEGRASDIHIEPLSDQCRIRYRIDGILHTSIVLPRYIHSSIVARIKVLANLKLDETRIPQDGRIRSIVNGEKIDFRVSILPLLNDEKVVMRVLKTAKKALTLEQLGFLDKHLEIIKRNIKKTSGMFLVTGPTGSGKSTTLFSILNILNKEGVNISTLEDPIEYFIKGVNQSQVRPEVNFTFASGLRSLLRQDPDIIMVGEIRDNETAELAIHSALTGHFVLSTLHTNSAIGAIPRLLDMGVEPFLLSSTLNVVIAQRLVRKICPYCKKEVKIPEEELEKITEEIKKMPVEYLKKYPELNEVKKIKFYKGEGCNRCGGTGYFGRSVISETLDITEELREIISKKVNLEEDNKAIIEQGFITIKQDGIIKAIQGITTIEEIIRVAE